VVFDEVSRMSRDAEEGFKVYQELYERGVELIFLKEPHISTTSYREALKGSIKVDVKSGDQDTDDLISGIMTALNKFMLAKVKADIKRAFEQSQVETDLRAQRAEEGIAEAKKHNKELEVLYPDTYKDHPEYSQIGREKGDKLTIKKAEPIKALIRKYSRDFDGTLSDMELLGVLSTKTVKIPNKKRSGKVEEREISAKISRNTLYKYKKEMREGV
jgi:DNA invertase Pin-like site-specific DNA recombinase